MKDLKTDKQKKAKARCKKHKTGIRRDEENGIVKNNTNPIIEHGYLDDMEEKGDSFDQWLMKYLDLDCNKNKRARQYMYTNNSRRNALGSLLYKMTTFYSENALKHLYPGEKN